MLALLLQNLAGPSGPLVPGLLLGLGSLLYWLGHGEDGDYQ